MSCRAIFLLWNVQQIIICTVSWQQCENDNVSYSCSVLDLSKEKVEQLESYLKAVKLFRNYEDPSEDPVYSEVRAPSNFIDKTRPDQKLVK